MPDIDIGVRFKNRVRDLYSIYTCICLASMFVFASLIKPIQVFISSFLTDSTILIVNPF